MLYEERVHWHDVEGAAARLFRIWDSRDDLEWARTAWIILAEAGLTELASNDAPDSDSEMNRYLIRFRLILLARFYHTYSEAAWGEGTPGVWVSWVLDDPLLSDRDNLRRLAPTFYDELLADDEGVQAHLPVEEYVNEVLGERTDDDYPRIVAALREGFGDWGTLFTSLWLTRSGRAPGWRRFPPAMLDEVLNDGPRLDDGRLRAHDWLVSGAPL